MIEHLPKVGNVPRLWERQGVDGFEEGLLCKRRDWWNGFSSHSEGAKRTFPNKSRLARTASG
jgi:hypothetical protein